MKSWKQIQLFNWLQVCQPIKFLQLNYVNYVMLLNNIDPDKCSCSKWIEIIHHQKLIAKIWLISAILEWKLALIFRRSRLWYSEKFTVTIQMCCAHIYCDKKSKIPILIFAIEEIKTCAINLSFNKVSRIECLQAVFEYIWNSLHKKWSFPLRVSSVNVTKSAVSCLLGHTHWKNP